MDRSGTQGRPMTHSQPLKNYFGRELALTLSDLIQPLVARFPVDSFVEAVTRQSESLELKGRVAMIAAELHQALAMPYEGSLEVLLDILGPENETEQGMFTNGYFLMPVAYYVERYGLQHFDLSMHALYEITKRHTSEYAIRPYLLKYEDQCLERLKAWRTDSSLHVRRLVSEGTRPRLPWAKRIPVIKGDPSHHLALIEPLLNDPSLYVRKSVANHLHDLSKDYRDFVITWLAERQHSGGEHFPWIVRHACRSWMKGSEMKSMHELFSSAIFTT
ncbi:MULTISPECIES: DNA alkylation repair protein [Paenibacillus]|nr:MULTISPECIES: DNA alkylation repair protein [Paenibacillus]MBP1892797.1 3-methyladenine DNA glycosylase AlkC [Paenibacillus lactis]MCM3495110.1 DNA alkylation repair protein [Paenibacillus lactis]GIO91739.1 hypothetical protein J31TS3_29660 [Paenibacillus lactis]